MTFRAINQKYLAPGAQLLMIFGIIALCQPWNLFPSSLWIDDDVSWADCLHDHVEGSAGTES